ncbi:MAG: hypothetical protein CMP48_21870 [Rickettsiales bacterium]|nr:hypothetical protein [Rickettsiales bacterium]
MFRSFLLIVLRKFRNRTSSSFVNFVCFTLGLTACIALFNYVHYELSYDQYKGSEDVYRLETHYLKEGKSTQKDAFTDYLLGQQLADKLDQIETIGQLIPYSRDRKGFFKNERNHNHLIQEIYYANKSTLKILSLELVHGEFETALSQPHSMLITESVAQKLFNKEWVNGTSIIGKELTSGERGLINNRFKITGILKETAENSHLHINALITLPGYDLANLKSSVYTYVKVEPEANLDSLNKLANIVYQPQEPEQRIFFQPIQAIHTTTGTSNEPGAIVSIILLLFLSGIGVLILGLASSNYVNNAIITAGDRAKEIGIRKLLGIKPTRLAATFFAEALLLNILSSVVAVIFFLLISHFVSTYSDINFPGPKWQYANDYLTIITLLIIVSTTLSSAYPAYYLSRLNPLQALNTKNTISFTEDSQASNVVKYLLIGQISISIFFLSAVYIIYEQLNYMNNSYTDAFEINVSGYFPGKAGADQKYLMEALHYFDTFKNNGTCSEITVTNLSNGKMITSMKIDSLFQLETNFSVGFNIIDHDYWKDSLDIFLKGRNFKRMFGSDPDKMIVNESAYHLLEELTLDSALLSKRFKVKAGYLELIGVVKNQSTNAPPQIYVSGFRYPTFFNATLKYPGKPNQSLEEFIRECEYFLQLKFPHFHFIDQELRASGNMEKEVFGLFIFFSLIAAIISNLGMYSLAEFVSSRRIKEMAIRKVLGARTIHILNILTIDFLKIMALGCIIAIPLILYSGRLWLDNYARRISFELTLIALPILVSLLIPLVIVLLKSWLTAGKRPLDSIHSN